MATGRARAEGAAGEHHRDEGGGDQEGEGGRQAGELGDGPDQGRAGEGAEVAEGGDGGDGQGRGELAGRRGGAEDGVALAYQLNVIINPAGTAIRPLAGHAPVRHVQAALLRDQQAPGPRALLDVLGELGPAPAA
jgi:hypothetical protein